MKPHPIALSLVAAIFLVAGGGYHFATRSPMEAVAASPGRPSAGAIHGISPDKPVPPTAGRTVVAPRDPRVPPRAARAENELGISPPYLHEARRLADEMASRLGQDLTVLQDAGYDVYSRSAGDPSRMLGLRLGVDADVLEKLGGILAEDRARRTERRIAAEKARLERNRTRLANDREAYVNYLALESMAARGHPLSGKQRAYYKEFRQAGEPDGEPAAAAGESEWYEKPEVLEKMHRHLTPDQQAELADYVDEQTARERERRETHARMRSGVIADRLGLDEAERTTLYDFLRGNPDASGPEIKDILAPELRELLPPGL